jgi:hypothetical protein
MYVLQGIGFSSSECHSAMHKEEVWNPQPTVILNLANTFTETSAITLHQMAHKLMYAVWCLHLPCYNYA